MSNFLLRLKPKFQHISGQSLPISALVGLGLGGIVFALQGSLSFCLAIGMSIFCLHCQLLTFLPQEISFLGKPKVIGILLGMLLFLSITIHADPALAQLFDTAQDQVESIFGQYIDSGIITFLFGLIRVVVWIAAVGFVFFAVYQAQRGEQWQPLAQNAFIVVAAVVLVEGLSTLFFGG